MANEHSSSNFTSNGIVMAALAASGALYFYHNPPLHGARPEMTETHFTRQLWIRWLLSPNMLTKPGPRMQI
jgi:hypothetical protein